MKKKFQKISLFLYFIMFFSIDLGGSTVDIVEFPHSFSGENSFVVRSSLESSEVDKNNLEEIFQKADINFSSAEKIVLTGGHSRTFSGNFHGIPLEVIPEIEAIGRGGVSLAKKHSALVCSLGTGTCFVSVKNGVCEHVGGSGVGGGTFLALSKMLLSDFQDKKKPFSFSDISLLVKNGNTKKVDLLVQDIVGRGIGIVPGSATASNLARLSSSAEKADIAAGVANMVGQTIASLAVFAAQTHNHTNIILGGKLVRLPHIIEVAQKTAALYKRNIFIPKNAEYLSAVGAGRTIINTEAKT